MNGSSEEPGKLFIGGLSWETTQDNLQRYFSRYGEVVDCVVMKNNETGRSRGFGFVTFKDPECVNIVLSGGPHELDGRTIDPKSCNPRGTTTAKVSNSGKVRPTSSASKGNNLPKVFLGGLPAAITETDLRMFFSKYGKVVEVVIMYDQERKKSRGFGFLSFDNEECVDRVCLEHYVTISGKQVECKKAEPRDSGSKRTNSSWGNSGGGGGGGNGGGWGGAQSQGMGNGMMGGYQGGWGTAQQPQQQQSYQAGYAANYQGWGAPTAATPAGAVGYNTTQYGGAAGAVTAGSNQYPQQGYSNYGYGYGTPAAQPQAGNGVASAIPDSYGQQGVTAGGGAAGGGVGGGQQQAGTGDVKAEYGYEFGTSYGQGDSNRDSTSRNTKTPYHPYQRST